MTKPIIIDGKLLEVEPGTTILQACETIALAGSAEGNGAPQRCQRNDYHLGPRR